MPIEAESNHIHFHFEAVDPPFTITDKLAEWSRECIHHEGGILHYINYIFCSDEYLHQINLDFLQHDTLTDIITFPYSDEAIESDIYISIARVVENAQTFGVSTQNELRRVMIHGVLHLLGYDDKSPEEQRSMRAKEEECLQRLGE